MTPLITPNTLFEKVFLDIMKIPFTYPQFIKFHTKLNNHKDSEGKVLYDAVITANSNIIALHEIINGRKIMIRLFKKSHPTVLEEIRVFENNELAHAWVVKFLLSDLSKKQSHDLI